MNKIKKRLFLSSGTMIGIVGPAFFAISCNKLDEGKQSKNVTYGYKKTWFGNDLSSAVYNFKENHVKENYNDYKSIFYVAEPDGNDKNEFNNKMLTFRKDKESAIKDGENILGNKVKLGKINFDKYDDRFDPMKFDDKYMQSSEIFNVSSLGEFRKYASSYRIKIKKEDLLKYIKYTTTGNKEESETASTVNVSSTQNGVVLSEKNFYSPRYNMIPKYSINTITRGMVKNGYYYNFTTDFLPGITFKVKPFVKNWFENIRIKILSFEKGTYLNPVKYMVEADDAIVSTQDQKNIFKNSNNGVVFTASAKITKSFDNLNYWNFVNFYSGYNYQSAANYEGEILDEINFVKQGQKKREISKEIQEIKEISFKQETDWYDKNDGHIKQIDKEIKKIIVSGPKDGSPIDDNKIKIEISGGKPWVASTEETTFDFMYKDKKIFHVSGQGTLDDLLKRVSININIYKKPEHHNISSYSIHKYLIPLSISNDKIQYYELHNNSEIEKTSLKGRYKIDLASFHDKDLYFDTTKELDDWINKNIKELS